MTSSLSIVNVQTNEKTKEITLDIRLTKNNAEGVEEASFSIDYLDGAKYDVADWTCRQQPHTIVSSWDTYKNLALNVKPEDLLKAIHPWVDKNKFKWQWGTVADSTWSPSNTALFDTFGALDNNSIYKGMHGKPVVNEFDKTITAIISKQQPNNPMNGSFSVCPIKVVISYREHPIYNINAWASTRIAQVQSYAMWHSYWEKALNLAINNPSWFVNYPYWMKLSAHGNGINVEDTWSAASHPHNYFILAMLLNNGFSFARKFQIYDKDYTKEPVRDGNRYIGRISIDFLYVLGHYIIVWCKINLYISFWLTNGIDKIGGGTPWNFIFSADVEIGIPDPS